MINKSMGQDIVGRSRLVQKRETLLFLADALGNGIAKLNIWGQGSWNGL